jgi:hypothetical protein
MARTLLRALEVGLPDLPDTFEEAIIVYRHIVSERNILIVLDGALSEQEVLDFLPANPRCGVIVTSRFTLAALSKPALITLDSLDVTSSINLLREISGDSSTNLRDEDVYRIVTSCAAHPLALRIVGARLASMSHYSVDAFCERLSDPDRLLDELEYGELSVRSGIADAYNCLDGEAQEMFRALSGLETSAFSLQCAVQFIETSKCKTHKMLDQLIEVRLIKPLAGSSDSSVRYTIDPLSAAYARERQRDARNSQNPQVRASSTKESEPDTHRRQSGHDGLRRHSLGADDRAAR